MLRTLVRVERSLENERQQEIHRRITIVTFFPRVIAIVRLAERNEWRYFEVFFFFRSRIASAVCLSFVTMRISTVAFTL